jgi:hypothetical protein
MRANGARQLALATVGADEFRKLHALSISVSLYMRQAWRLL